ncbi:11558_t:CDS:2, partial [Gigaspora margarita]
TLFTKELITIEDVDLLVSLNDLLIDLEPTSSVGIEPETETKNFTYMESQFLQLLLDIFTIIHHELEYIGGQKNYEHQQQMFVLLGYNEQEENSLLCALQKNNKKNPESLNVMPKHGHLRASQSSLHLKDSQFKAKSL